MARFKKLPVNENTGKISYGIGIVNNIVQLALNEIPFIKVDKGTPNNSAIKVYADKDGVNIDVAIKIYFTQSISETSFKIQEAIRHNVEAMTEYRVASVNVSIIGVLFENDLEGLSVEPKDKPTTDENSNTDDTTKETK